MPMLEGPSNAFSAAFVDDEHRKNMIQLSLDNAKTWKEKAEKEKETWDAIIAGRHAGETAEREELRKRWITADTEQRKKQAEKEAEMARNGIDERNGGGALGQGMARPPEPFVPTPFHMHPMHMQHPFFQPSPVMSRPSPQSYPQQQPSTSSGSRKRAAAESRKEEAKRAQLMQVPAYPHPSPALNPFNYPSGSFSSDLRYPSHPAYSLHDPSTYPNPMRPFNPSTVPSMPPTVLPVQYPPPFPGGAPPSTMMGGPQLNGVQQSGQEQERQGEGEKRVEEEKNTQKEREELGGFNGDMTEDLGRGIDVDSCGLYNYLGEIRDLGDLDAGDFEAGTSSQGNEQGGAEGGTVVPPMGTVAPNTVTQSSPSIATAMHSSPHTNTLNSGGPASVQSVPSVPPVSVNTPSTPTAAQMGPPLDSSTPFPHLSLSSPYSTNPPTTSSSLQYPPSSLPYPQQYSSSVPSTSMTSSVPPAQPQSSQPSSSSPHPSTYKSTVPPTAPSSSHLPSPIAPSSLHPSPHQPSPVLQSSPLPPYHPPMPINQFAPPPAHHNPTTSTVDQNGQQEMMMRQQQQQQQMMMMAKGPMMPPETAVHQQQHQQQAAMMYHHQAQMAHLEQMHVAYTQRRLPVEMHAQYMHMMHNYQRMRMMMDPMAMQQQQQQQHPTQPQPQPYPSPFPMQAYPGAMMGVPPQAQQTTQFARPAMVPPHMSPHYMQQPPHIMQPYVLPPQMP